MTTHRVVTTRGHLRRVPRLLAALLCLGCASTPTPAASDPSELHAAAMPAAAAADPLPSWNDGPRKQAILAFVAKISDADGSDFVPPPQRIAVFDNDGTLWAEQPMYFQAAFAIDRVRALAPQHPEWQTQQPWKGALEGDFKAAFADGERAFLQLIMTTHAGLTTEEFEDIVRDWIQTAKHPTTKLRYVDMVYQPMLELLAYLRANEFKTFIVSGGGIEFMRPWTEAAYGIPPEQVVGSSGKLKLELRGEQPVIVKLPELDFIDDKAGKPVGIQSHIGRRPIFAAGNSDGDLQMLQWTAAGAGPRFMLFVHHTDAEREWAYDRQSAVGRFDEGLDVAAAKGWTVVDMKRDWKRVFKSTPSPQASAVAAR